MEYKPDKEKIVKRIAGFFKEGDYVNLGIGLPTKVGNYIPDDGSVVLQSENGFLGLGPAPEKGCEIENLENAGGELVTIQTGGSYFDSAFSFGIIRGGHIDYTVLGVFEVDQKGNLANYKVPGKMVPGMGGAMDLVVGARTVIAASLHFDKSGNSKLCRECRLPNTARSQVNIVVTDLGVFIVGNDKFILEEVFEPYNVDYVLEHTNADIEVAEKCKVVTV